MGVGGRLEAIMSTVTPYPYEVNPLPTPDYHETERREVSVDELASSGGKFTRIRLLTEYGYPGMDVSYVHGVLGDGTPVRVWAGFIGGLSRRKYRSEIQDALIQEGISRSQCNRMGVWDSSVYSILY
jgi:hypothetical protein